MPVIDGLHPRRRPPSLIRLLWLAVTAAIAYLSLYPLAGWRLRQPSLFAFLSQGLPRYYSHADLVSNVAAYVIFGLLFALGWSSRRHPWLPALLAALAGILLSLGLEAMQSYLPTRVPSMLDFSANAAGAAARRHRSARWSATTASGSAPGPTPASRQWYEQGPAIGWALIVIWVISQLPTQRLLFSTGNLQSWLPQTLPRLVAHAAGAAAASRRAAAGVVAFRARNGRGGHHDLHPRRAGDGPGAHPPAGGWPGSPA